MSISNVTYKNMGNLTRRVDEAFEGTRDRDSNSQFFEEQNKKKAPELPKDIDELFTLVSNEVERFKNLPAIKEQKVQYRAVKTKDKVVVMVSEASGNVIRTIEPLDFLNMAQNYKGGLKGSILNLSF